VWGVGNLRKISQTLSGLVTHLLIGLGIDLKIWLEGVPCG
jgi:hypothetical protein